MAVKVGINGFGRIGRQVFKVLWEKYRDSVEVVGVNDLTDDETLAHLLKYDSVSGRYEGTVTAKEKAIVVDGKEVQVTAEKNPADLKWGDLGVELVLESTGVFRKKEQCLLHVKAGAKKVLLSVPPKDAVDAIVVKGVNDDALKGTEQVVSNASCTTNCLAPMAMVLHESFVIKRGLMTTITPTPMTRRFSICRTRICGGPALRPRRSSRPPRARPARWARCCRTSMENCTAWPCACRSRTVRSWTWSRSSTRTFPPRTSMPR